MKPIKILMNESIGGNYPVGTGRLLEVGNGLVDPHKVGFLGDSTIENGYWVDADKSYCSKTHTVPFQVAEALSKENSNTTFKLGNYAVDGFTTSDLLYFGELNKVIPLNKETDLDHTAESVFPVQTLCHWKPNTVVLSVGGNNYREALQCKLQNKASKATYISPINLLLRQTPDHVKEGIKSTFHETKETLFNEYVSIIDKLLEFNSNLQRLVLVSQYYPAITMFTGYHIYTGFSHVAAAEGNHENNFSMMQNTMEELYKRIMDYVAEKNIEIVFVDMASSLNPLAGYHAWQIEPNERGSKVMGKMVASAITHEFEDANDKRNNKIILRLSDDERTIEKHHLPHDNELYHIRSIYDYISSNRYRHLQPTFNNSYIKRLQNTYHFFAGNHFDSEYYGLFAFGLVDLSFFTIIAAYLWRHTINQDNYLITRIITGFIAIPILVMRFIISSILTLLMTPFVAMVHYMMKLFPEEVPNTYYQYENRHEVMVSSRSNCVLPIKQIFSTLFILSGLLLMGYFGYKSYNIAMQDKTVDYLNQNFLLTLLGVAFFSIGIAIMCCHHNNHQIIELAGDEKEERSDRNIRYAQ